MDKRGVIDLPLKLMVSVLIIGMMLPTTIALTDRMMDEVDVQEIESCAESLKRDLVRTYYDGIGGSRTVTLNIPTGYSMAIGGENEEYVIRMMENGEIISRMYLDSPPFPIVGGELILENNCVLSMKAVVSGSVIGLEVMPV